MLLYLYMYSFTFLLKTLRFLQLVKSEKKSELYDCENGSTTEVWCFLSFLQPLQQNQDVLYLLIRTRPSLQLTAIYSVSHIKDASVSNPPPPSPPPVRFLQHIYKRYQSQRLSPGSPRWSSTIVWSTAESVHASLAASLSSLLCVTQSVCLRLLLVLSQPRLHCSRFFCWQWNQQLLMRGQVGSCRRLRNQCQLCQRGVCSVGFKCLSVVFYD